MLRQIGSLITHGPVPVRASVDAQHQETVSPMNSAASVRGWDRSRDFHGARFERPEVRTRHRIGAGICRPLMPEMAVGVGVMCGQQRGAVRRGTCRGSVRSIARWPAMAGTRASVNRIRGPIGP